MGESTEVKLVKLTAENILAVKAVELAFDEKNPSAVLLGRNKAGKTSIIDILGIALGQTKNSNPLKRGERKGFIIAEFDKFTIEKQFSERGTPKIKITDLDGKRYASPAELLKDFVNTVTFNPSVFVGSNKKAQIAALCLAFGVDLDAHEFERTKIYDDRTEVGRDKKRVTGIVDALEKPASNVPDEEISISDLTAKLNQYNSDRTARSVIEDELHRITIALDGKVENINSLETGITTAKENESTHLANIFNQKQILPEDPKEKIAELKKQLSAAEELQDSYVLLARELELEEARLKDCQKEIESKTIKQNGYKSEHISLGEEQSKKHAELSNHPDRKFEIQSVNDKIQDLESINRSVRDKKKYEAAFGELNATDEQYSELSIRIKDMDEALRDRLSNAGLPKGIEIDDGNIYKNNILFENWSTQEKLEFAFEVGSMIKPEDGMHNTKILTMDVSQFDPDNRKLLIDMATQKGFTAILEVAGIAKRNAFGELQTAEHYENANTFYIEDGESELIEEIKEDE